MIFFSGLLDIRHRKTLFMSLLDAEGYLEGWRNAPCIGSKCLQVLSGDRQQTKPAPGLRWCGCPRVPLSTYLGQNTLAGPCY